MNKKIYCKCRTRRETKAQAEIIGITIVMVLIMLGIIFAIRFVIIPEDANIKQSYDRNQMAANFMDAMLKTTTPCNTLTFTELIQDCAENHGSEALQYNCPAAEVHGVNVCNGVDSCRSCVFLNNSLGVLMEHSIDKMLQYRYDFFICRWDAISNRCLENEILSQYSSVTPCLGQSRDYDSKQQPIPTAAGNRVVQMYIC